VGDYTGLRCRIIIKEEFREEFYQLHDNSYEWLESNIDFLKSFGEYNRSAFIPRGSIAAYMPDEWIKDDEKTNGEFTRSYNKETGLWVFQCSLKNYNQTIEYFLEHVLSKITKEVIHLEYLYESWIVSTLYELKDGVIVESKIDGIKYGYEEN
jgi:hypothetical protein